MNDFLSRQKDAKRLMEMMRTEREEETFVSLFNDYIRDKFNINKDVSCSDLYNLALMSIRGGTESSADVTSVSEKRDCHNISSPVKKLTLFLFHVEKEFGIVFDDWKLLDVNTTDDLARYCYSLLGVQDV